MWSILMQRERDLSQNFLRCVQQFLDNLSKTDNHAAKLKKAGFEPLSQAATTFVTFTV